MSGPTSIVALTGGTGFIGSHVLQRLLKDGWRVRVLVREETRLPRLTKEQALHLEIVRGDLQDDTALQRLVQGAKALVHVAGVVKARDRAQFLQFNAQASGRLASIAADARVRRFVHVSSLAAREPQLSSYAYSKHAGEKAVWRFSHRFSCIILRPPAVYGPGDEATFPLIDQLSRARAYIPGNRKARFSLIHVDDLARAIAFVADDEIVGTFELDDGRRGGYSWQELAQIAARVLGRPVRLRLLPRWLLGLAGRGAEMVARIGGRPMILTAEKVNELYHEDWLARPPLLQEHVHWTARRQFAEGFLDTLRYWCEAGRLPKTRLPACEHNSKA